MNNLAFRMGAHGGPLDKSGGGVSVSGALLLTFALTLPFTRNLGGINLVVFGALCAAYALVLQRQRLLPLPLLLFSAFSAVFAVLSVFSVFPRAWTRLHDISAIPQQALYAVALPATFVVMRKYFQRFMNDAGDRKRLAMILFSLWILSKIIGAVMNFAELDLSRLIGIRQMGNTSALVIGASVLYLSTQKNLVRRLPIIAGFVALSFLSIFSQNVVYALVFSLIWIFPRLAFILTAGFVACSVILYVVFISDPYAVYFIDNNLTVRLILIKDALQGVVQSGFLGVGFGTESITNDYSAMGLSHFTSDEAESFIHLAVHNSYATVFFRLGLIGFTLLGFFLYGTAKLLLAKGMPALDKAARCSLFLAFFVVTYQNPALESYVYLYGVCLYLSMIWAMGSRGSIYRTPSSLGRVLSDHPWHRA